VSFRDGRLSVETRGEALGEVLAEVQKKSGIKFHVRKTLPTDAISASFRDVPVETDSSPAGARLRSGVVLHGAQARPGRTRAEGGLGRGAGRARGGLGADAGRGSVRRQPKPGDSADLKARLTAIEKLADENATKALPLLLSALSDKDARVRAAAAEVLGEVGGPNAVPALSAGLKDPDSGVREAVVDALADIGGPEAERLLRQALADSDEDVRDAAVAALAKMKQTKK
jgi:HEAT repeats